MELSLHDYCRSVKATHRLDIFTYRIFICCRIGNIHLIRNWSLRMNTVKLLNNLTSPQQAVKSANVLF